MSDPTTSSPSQEDQSITISTASSSIKVLSDGSVHFPPDLNYNQWFGCLRTLKSIKGLYHKALCEAVSYGKVLYGDDLVEEALEQLEFDLADARNAIAYSHTSSPVRVMEQLTEEHRFVLGRSFPDAPEKQQEWADKAVKHNLNPASLKVSIATGEIKQKDERSPGIISFEQVAVMFERCLKQMGPSIHLMNKDERIRIANLFRVVANFVEEMTSAEEV